MLSGVELGNTLVLKRVDVSKVLELSIAMLLLLVAVEEAGRLELKAALLAEVDVSKELEAIALLLSRAVVVEYELDAGYVLLGETDAKELEATALLLSIAEEAISLELCCAILDGRLVE